MPNNRVRFVERKVHLGSQLQVLESLLAIKRNLQLDSDSI